jgi:hypothetical protein
MTRTTSVRAAFLTIGILCVVALVPRLAGDFSFSKLGGAETAPPVREIRLIARDMTFYIDGDQSRNPTLHARPGERIRIVLRNTEPGISHDFTIPTWGVQSRVLKGKGEDRIEFTVPDKRGMYAYSCSPHAAMMNGNIEVQ